MTAVRTLLTVLVAAALMSASMPAIDEARADRTAARLDAAAARLVDASTALAASDDPVSPGERGASRTVVVALPHAGFADARAAYLSIGGLPNASAPSVVGYRVTDRPPRQVDAGVAFHTAGDPLVLAPGRHTLRLTLVRTTAGVGVRVRPVSRRIGAETRSNQSAVER